MSGVARHVRRFGARSLRAQAAPFVVAAAVALTVAACTAPDTGSTGAGPAPLVGAPAESTLKADSVSVAVRRGRALLNSTADSLPKHVGNELRCTSCHLSDGRRAFAMAWVGVSKRYPQFRSRSGKTDQLPDRINDCFQRSLNGTALDPAGRDMHDIIAYLTWLSADAPADGKVRGRGIDSLAPLLPDTANGAKVYAAKCAQCHGANGGGVPGPRLFRGGENTIASPLWGPQSYNIGAGMARLRVAAAFIARQMPLEKPGTLTQHEAFDLAGLIDAKPRPDFARKAADWPAGGAPPDVAYATDYAARKPGARP